MGLILGILVAIIAVSFLLASRRVVEGLADTWPGRSKLVRRGSQFDRAERVVTVWWFRLIAVAVAVAALAAGINSV